MKKIIFRASAIGPMVLAIVLGLSISPVALNGQTTDIPFDGDLFDSSITGNLDMQFRLFDLPNGGTQIGSTIQMLSIDVYEGRFKVGLDFTATPFTGDDRWLEIQTSPSGANTYTALPSRIRMRSAPYAIKAINAEQLAGTPASTFVQTSDPRLADERPPSPGSGNYIQNMTSAQSAANFNISGNGTAGGTLSGNTVNSWTQYNIGNARILIGQGRNLYAGFGAGYHHTTGFSNSAFGYSASRLNTTGANNTSVGDRAGYSNSVGSENAMFGSSAGSSNTAGHNSFFGANSGSGNTTGQRNALFGHDAGYRNTTGSYNTFVGASVGDDNLGGSYNTFLGYLSGNSNTSGSNNSTLGSSASVGSNLTYATAIGSGAIVSSSNTIVLGRSSETVRVPGILVVSNLGTAGGSTLCRNSSLQIALCSSSIRYKSNVMPYTPGLELVEKLRPVSFNWRDGGAPDFGLVAEDVNKVDPLLSVYNDQGEIEGVKYDRVGVVLINAIKEQQVQIERQRQEIVEQRSLIDGLRALICQSQPRAAVCKLTAVR